MNSHQSEIEQDILSLLSAHSGQKLSRENGDLKIMDDLGLDSFSLVELIYELEFKYKIQVTNEQIKKIETVGEFIKGIQNL